MLCPEVWKFSPSANNFKFKSGRFDEGKIQCSNLMDFHYYNHLVQVVLPDALSVPETIKNLLIEDCDYYVIEDVVINELINKEFIEAFVKKGQLTALSDGMKIDADDCVALTPSGELVLSLNKQTYQELGLEGRASIFSRVKQDRYVVILDLKKQHFTPGKKNYDRVCECLTNNARLNMNLLVTWKPPEERICPSSVAAYFSSRGYRVRQCEPKFVKQIAYNVRVPVYNDSNNDEDALELMEWLGAFSIGADLKEGDTGDFLNSYQYPLENVDVGAVVQMQWRGYFTASQIHALFDELRRYVSQRSSIPWVSLYVQGFADSPINWGLKEHQFYTNGDNSYVIFLKPNNRYLTCSYISPSKRPKSKINK
ncbi:ribonuclease P protein subunit p40-like isoform X1 [Periplaneta americana]|uniref:ribonuclease P protein subunit p40-like isoform X1 n=1 Tax=Periplaneta americana TaxID=6978 RepID=UPI0037E7A939